MSSGAMPSPRVDHRDHRIVIGPDVVVRRRVVLIKHGVFGRKRQVAAGRHRIAGIGREVGESGLELRRIGDHGPDIVGEIEHDVDLVAEGTAEQPRDAAPDR
jgi:hypothetical protein